MKNKINSLNTALITLALNKSLFLGLVFSFFFHVSKTSAIWGVLLGIIFSIPLYFLFLKVIDILPDLTITEKIKKIFPKYISNILNIILNICVFLIGILLLWRLSSFISTEFLAQTNTLFILILVTFPILYLGFNNFDTLGRFSIIALTICFFIIIFNILGTSSNIDIDNLKPFFNESFTSILKSGIYYAILYSTPVFMLTMIKKNEFDKKEKFNKYIWLSFIESSISIFAIFTCVLAVLGTELITLYTYPEFTVLKVINIFSFIENVENICTMLWVFYLIISTSVCLMFIKESIITKFRIINNKKKNKIALLICLAMFLIVFFTKDYSYYIDKFSLVNIPFIICLVILLIMLFTLIFYYFKKKSIK